MKLFLTFIITSVLLFAQSNTNIEKKLDYLIKRMNKMEKQLNNKDNEIEKLKHEVNKQKVETKKEFMTKSCDKLKVEDFSFIYHKNVLPYYTLNYKLKNTYPYDISRVSGKLYIKDSDDITMLTDFVDKEQNLPKGSYIVVNKTHSIQSDLEKTLKDDKQGTEKLSFHPLTIEFKNGQKINCGGILGVSF